MYRYLFTNKKNTFLFFLLTPLKAACDVAVSWIITEIIDNAIAGNIQVFPRCIALFIAYLIIDFLLDVYLEHIRLNITMCASVQMKKELFQRLMHTGVSQYREKSTASYLSTIENDVETICDTYFFIIDSATEIVTMIAAIAFVFWYSWQIGIMLIVLTLVQAFVPKLFDKRMDRAGTEYSDKKADYLDRLEEGLAGYLTSRIFHTEKRVSERFCNILRETEQKWKNREFTEALVTTISYIFNQISYIGVFILGGFLMVNGTLRLSVIVAITNLTHYISSPALYLVSDIAKLKIAAEPYRKIQAILNMEEDNGGEKELTSEIKNLNINSVTCKYTERTVLSKVNYQFDLGKKYLLIGQSGSGKSTLLSILAGILDNYSGHVELGGTDIRDLSRRCLTRNVCYIDQEPFMFHDTVYQNVALYEDIDENEVKGTLCRVGLGSRISEMENGIHTVLEENAASLSGGEKQRLAIARALVRHTPILLMDESTSHLDPQTAADIESLLCSLENITLILVSHNATQTAMKGMDAVLEIKNGTIAS